MGLLVSVYRNAEMGDCTRNGISARFTRLCVVNIEGPFEPTDDTPAVRLEQPFLGYLCIVPVKEKDAGEWLQSGGNYAACSDSRFNEACTKMLGHDFYGAVKIHDRIE